MRWGHRTKFYTGSGTALGGLAKRDKTVDELKLQFGELSERLWIRGLICSRLSEPICHCVHVISEKAVCASRLLAKPVVKPLRDSRLKLRCKPQALDRMQSGGRCEKKELLAQTMP